MRTMEHLTEEQIKYLCSKIPAGYVKAYFNRYPSNFRSWRRDFGRNHFLMNRLPPFYSAITIMGLLKIFLLRI